MSTTPNISNGQQASASALNGSFQAIKQQGTSILALLTQVQLSTLVNYNRRLTDLSSKQCRAARVKASEIAALFVVSDFNDIDQGLTTATIRIDTASATLRERRVPTTALVTSTAFSASTGTVNALNADQTLLSVFASTVPTGTFTLELQEAVNLSVLTIELSAMASSPAVTVQVSSNGLVYIPASSISLNGDVLNAWFPASEVQFIQVILTPTHPDNLGGDSYTFGITDFSATTVSYNLVSDIYYKTISLAPQSQFLIFHAEGTGNLVYNLLLDDGTPRNSYTALVDGSSIPVPGTNAVNLTGIAIGAGGVLQTSLPANVYSNSITVTDTTTGTSFPVIEGLSSSDPLISSLQQPVAAVSGLTVTILPTPATTTDVYSISCLTGPGSVNATLLVHLSTSDRTQTPVFKGASLEDQ